MAFCFFGRGEEDRSTVALTSILIDASFPLLTLFFPSPWTFSIDSNYKNAISLY